MALVVSRPFWTLNKSEVHFLISWAKNRQNAVLGVFAPLPPSHREGGGVWSKYVDFRLNLCYCHSDRSVCFLVEPIFAVFSEIAVFPLQSYLRLKTGELGFQNIEQKWVVNEFQPKIKLAYQKHHKFRKKWWHKRRYNRWKEYKQPLVCCWHTASCWKWRRMEGIGEPHRREKSGTRIRDKRQSG